MSDYVRLYQIMSDYVRLCQIMTDYDRLCQIMSYINRFLQIMTDHDQLSDPDGSLFQQTVDIYVSLLAKASIFQCFCRKYLRCK